jgi:hypothetical protein
MLGRVLWESTSSKSAANIKRTLVRFKGKAGVSREGGTPEDDAESYYVVEL